MTLLEFRPEYSVGIESMDFEHRQMINLINEIYEEMKDRRDVESVEQFLGDVHAAISLHFALEEKMMRDAAYAEYEDHKDDHEELLDQMHDLIDTFHEDNERGFSVLQEKLSNWFANHFSTFDARLHGKLPH
jgi:hemerythrin